MRRKQRKEYGYVEQSDALFKVKGRSKEKASAIRLKLALKN